MLNYAGVILNSLIGVDNMKKRISFVAKTFATSLICLGMSVNTLANETVPVEMDEPPIIEENVLPEVTTYSVNVQDGTAFVYGENGELVPTNQVEPWNTITLVLDESRIPENYGFVGWEASNDFPDSSATVNLNNPTSKTACTFQMPDRDIEIIPKYEKFYNIEAVGGEVHVYVDDGYGIYPELSNQAMANQMVSVRLIDEASEGQCFDKWVVDTENLTLGNERDMYISFTMPAEDVKVHPTFAEGYRIQADCASIYNERTNGYNDVALPGDLIHLCGQSWMMPEGDVFEYWQDVKGNAILNNPTSFEECTFTMPEGDVHISAKLKNNHWISLPEPASSIVEGNNQSYASKNSTVQLSYSDYYAPEGKIFKRWKVVSGNVALSDPYSKYDCIFTMPDEDVVIDIEYDKGFAVEAMNGEVMIENSSYPTGEKVYVKPGAKVQVRFDRYNTFVPIGQVFDGWKTSNNITLTKETMEDTWSFIMPEEDVRLEPHYISGRVFTIQDEYQEDIVETYKPGTPVTFHIWTIQNDQGKVIKELKVVQGTNVQIKKDIEYDSQMVYSFTMPDEDVVIQVVYEDGYLIKKDANIHAINLDEQMFNVNAARPGTKIRLSYFDDGTTNQIFKKFIVKSGNVDLQYPDSAINCYFYMPEGDVEIGVEVEEGKHLFVEAGLYSIEVLNSYPDTNEGYVLSGSDVYIYADVNSNPNLYDQCIAGWKVVSGPEITLEKVKEDYIAKCAVFRFKMPNEDIRLQPIFEEDIAKISFDLNGGTYHGYVPSEAPEYEVVKKNTSMCLPYLMNVEPPEHKTFKAWLVDGVEYNQGDEIFIDSDTTVQIVWKTLDASQFYPLFVTGGQPSRNGLPIFSGKAEQGKKVLISLSVSREGDGFLGWYAAEEDVVLENPTSRTDCTFIMPEHPVHIFAKFKDRICVIYDYNGMLSFRGGGGVNELRSSFDGKYGAYVQGSYGNQGFTLKVRDDEIIEHPDTVQLYGWKVNGHIYKPSININVKEDTVLLAVWLTNAEVEHVEALIQTISSIGNVSLQSKEVIEEAERLYQGLTDTEKEAVDIDYISALQTARTEYDRLKSEEDQAQADANYVDRLIGSIGIVTSDTVEWVIKAREEYDALSDAAKSKVQNLDILLNAEAIVDDVLQLSESAKEEIKKASKYNKDLVKTSDLAELDKSFKKIKELLMSRRLTEEERKGLELAAQEIEEMKTILSNIQTSMNDLHTQVQSLDLNKLNSKDLHRLKQMRTQMDDLLKGQHVTEAERNALQIDRDLVVDQIERIHNIEMAVQKKIKAISKYDKQFVKSSDIPQIEKIIKDIDSLLATSNLTKPERESLLAHKKVAQELIDTVRKVQAKGQTPSKTTTGAQTNIILWMTLAACSCGALVVAMILLRKKKHE